MQLVCVRVIAMTQLTGRRRPSSTTPYINSSTNCHHHQLIITSNHHHHHHHSCCRRSTLLARCWPAGTRRSTLMLFVVTFMFVFVLRRFSRDDNTASVVLQPSTSDRTSSAADSADFLSAQRLFSRSAQSTSVLYSIRWRRSVVVSALSSINVVNRHWARLLLG